jgi:hypothetical protein
MNRYSSITTSEFNPLSFQEIMAAPLAMRQKHDASIAAAEAMRIKTDPYSKHYNRALELKQQMDNEIAKNVDTLNKEGYNPTTFQNITKLNRQYQDMISPTGEIGQINAENINIKKINEEYDKLGKEKNWGQETVDYWKNKALKEYNEKPLYDANGRILSYSGPEGVVNKVDYNKRLHELASSAKMSVSEFSNAVTKLGMDEKSGYNVANKNSEAHKLGDNYARVKDAYDTLKKEIYDPTSEVHKSMRYEGRDPRSLLDILKTQSDIYRQNVKSDEYSKYINPFGSGPSPSEESSNIGNFEKIPYGVENTSGSTDLSDRINSIGGKSIGKALSYSYDVLTGNKPQAQTKSEFDKARSQVFLKPEDVLQGGELTIYNNAKKQVSKNTPGFNKLSVTEQNKLIGDKASKDILTFSPIVIKPTVKSVGALIPGVQKGSDINSIGGSMWDDAVAGNRTFYDVETGDPIPKEDIKANTASVKLYGITAPHNLKTQKMKGATEDQKISPIIATVTNKDGVKYQVYVSRTGTERASPEFQKIKSANSVFNGVINNMNTQVRITDKNSNMYGSKVTYDSSITDGYPIIITSPNGKPERISLDEFQNDAL